MTSVGIIAAFCAAAALAAPAGWSLGVGVGDQRGIIGWLSGALLLVAGILIGWGVA